MSGVIWLSSERARASGRIVLGCPRLSCPSEGQGTDAVGDELDTKQDPQDRDRRNGEIAQGDEAQN